MRTEKTDINSEGIVKLSTAKKDMLLRELI